MIYSPFLFWRDLTIGILILGTVFGAAIASEHIFRPDTPREVVAEFMEHRELNRDDVQLMVGHWMNRDPELRRDDERLRRYLLEWYEKTYNTMP